MNNQNKYLSAFNEKVEKRFSLDAITKANEFLTNGKVKDFTLNYYEASVVIDDDKRFEVIYEFYSKRYKSRCGCKNVSLCPHCCTLYIKTRSLLCPFGDEMVIGNNDYQIEINKIIIALKNRIGSTQINGSNYTFLENIIDVNLKDLKEKNPSFSRKIKVYITLFAAKYSLMLNENARNKLDETYSKLNDYICFDIYNNIDFFEKELRLLPSRDLFLNILIDMLSFNYETFIKEYEFSKEKFQILSELCDELYSNYSKANMYIKSHIELISNSISLFLDRKESIDYFLNSKNNLLNNDLSIYAKYLYLKGDYECAFMYFQMSKVYDSGILYTYLDCLKKLGKTFEGKKTIITFIKTSFDLDKYLIIKNKYQEFIDDSIEQFVKFNRLEKRDINSIEKLDPNNVMLYSDALDTNSFINKYINSMDYNNKDMFNIMLFIVYKKICDNSESTNRNELMMLIDLFTKFPNGLDYLRIVSTFASWNARDVVREEIEKRS